MSGRQLTVIANYLFVLLILIWESQINATENLKHEDTYYNDQKS